METEKQNKQKLKNDLPRGRANTHSDRQTKRNIRKDLSTLYTGLSAGNTSDSANSSLYVSVLHFPVGFFVCLFVRFFEKP